MHPDVFAEDVLGARQGSLLSCIHTASLYPFFGPVRAGYRIFQSPPKASVERVLLPKERFLSRSQSHTELCTYLELYCCTVAGQGRLGYILFRVSVASVEAPQT
jgi:hypothetical protein